MSFTTHSPVALTHPGHHLLDAAEDCCHAMHLVHQAYSVLERFNFLDAHMTPEDMPVDRQEFGALLARINESALRSIDDALAAIQHARRAAGAQDAEQAPWR